MGIISLLLTDSWDLVAAGSGHVLWEGLLGSAGRAGLAGEDSVGPRIAWGQESVDGGEKGWKVPLQFLAAALCRGLAATFIFAAGGCGGLFFPGFCLGGLLGAALGYGADETRLGSLLGATAVGTAISRMPLKREKG